MTLDPRRLEDETGASSVEYGLLAAGVAGVVVGAILALGGATDEMFTNSCQAFTSQEEIAGDCD